VNTSPTIKKMLGIFYPQLKHTRCVINPIFLRFIH